MGDLNLIEKWYKSFQKIGGKIYSSTRNDNSSHFFGTLTNKQLPDFRKTFLVEENHLKSFDAFPKDPFATFVFMSDRTIECGCNSGCWLVWGEWRTCSCKGTGRRYPEAGRIMLEKTFKPETQQN